MFLFSPILLKSWIRLEVFVFTQCGKNSGSKSKKLRVTVFGLAAGAFSLTFKEKSRYNNLSVAILFGTRAAANFWESWKKKPNAQPAWEQHPHSAFGHKHILKRVDEVHGPSVNATCAERKKNWCILTGREQRFRCVWALVSDRDNGETQTKTH